MLSINCLLKNTKAVEHIKSAIQMLVGDYIDKTGTARIQDIYYDLRKMGLEVDAESIGDIYNRLYGGIEDDAVSTTDEVEEFTGRAFRKQMNGIVDNVINGQAAPIEQQLGNESPEVSAVNAIAKLFQGETFGATPKISSALRQMQDLVTKSAITLLPKSERKGQGLTESLNHFFSVESNKFETLDGKVNTLETLHNAVKQQVADYVETASENLTEEEKGLLQDQWNQYTQAFMDSAYDIVLNKGNQNNLVNESLKQIQVDGVNIVDINGNIKWDALIEYGNPDTIADKISTLFQQGFKDKDGTVTKYTPAQADRIGDYFKRLYIDKLNTAKDRAINNNRVRNQSATNIISDFLKDRGFFNVVKDKNGKLLLTQANWTDAIQFIKKQIGTLDVGADKNGKKIRGLDLVQQKLRVFLNSQKNADGTPKFTDNQKRLIEDEFVKNALAKLVPATRDVDSVEKLIALSDLNNSRAFEQETQQAINKVVGVSGLNQATLDKIQSLAKTAQSILAGSQANLHHGNANLISLPNAPQQTGVNRAAYAYTALVEIDRKIKEILRDHKINNSDSQRAIKYFSDLLGGGTISLLLNPNNAVENIFTQTATNVGESMNMLFTNPTLFFKTFGKLQGDFWHQWLNYAQGGASNEIANESDLSSDLQSSERLRVRGVLNEFKDKKVFNALGSVVAKSPQYITSIFSRTLMNSFDAATTTSLMRKKLIQSTYEALINQGNSPAEVLQLMDKTFKISSSIDAEIKKENARIEKLLTAAGLHPNKVMMAQNERDMRMSVYEDVIRDNAANSGASVSNVAEATKSLVESAQMQAKVLGGKRQIPTQDVISNIIYGAANGLLKPQKNLFNSAREAEADGNLKKAAGAQLKASLYQNFFGKFVGGVANFMNLAISATPFGFMASSSLYKQQNELLKKNPNAKDIYTADPELLKKYTELHGLARSITTRATMGSIAIAAFIAKALLSGGGGGDDDDTENWFKNLMATKTGRRLAQKQLPISIALLAPLFYQHPEKMGDTELTMMADMFNIYTGKDFNAMANLFTSLKYAETSEAKRDVYARFVGNLVTTYNVNQPEQIVRFQDAVSSIFNKSKIATVEENQAISKEIYKSTEGLVNSFLLNGAIDAAGRVINPDKKYNRFTNKDEQGDISW